MKIKKIMKRLLITVLVLIALVIVIGLGFWLIDGRSPQAYIVAHSLTMSTMEDYEKAKLDKTDKSRVEIPEDVEFPREVKEYTVSNMQVFEVVAEDDSKPIVLYIHGGAYLHNFSSRHWSAMSEWSEDSGCGLVIPNYPLLYLHTVSDAFPLMVELYTQLRERFPNRRIIIMGDSAGGGFSLALSQEIVKNDSLANPDRLILISPWVDVVGGDDSLQEYDTFLNIKLLRLVGADWAGEIDAHNPKVSPLYGDMHGLPPTDIFAGTWETFYTDIVSTYEKMKSSGVDVRIHIKEKMGHVYPLWPCPEGKDARKDITSIINQK